MNAMMNDSCNRSSVAIGEHIAEAVLGDPREFINMMNTKAFALNLSPIVFGHPAGGSATRPQGLITLLREGGKHPLFNQLGGVDFYEDDLCGTDGMGEPKCNGPFRKINTIGDYPGRRVWKGGRGGLWWFESEANNVPAFPQVPWATASAVAIVDRVDRSFAMSLMQSGDRTPDARRLLDHGIRKVFTPDRYGDLEFPTSGGIVGPEGPIRVKNFAIDRITANSGVTAIIDDFEEMDYPNDDVDFYSDDN